MVLVQKPSQPRVEVDIAIPLHQVSLIILALLIILVLLIIFLFHFLVMMRQDHLTIHILFGNEYREKDRLVTDCLYSSYESIFADAQYYKNYEKCKPLYELIYGIICQIIQIYQ